MNDWSIAFRGIIAGVDEAQARKRYDLQRCWMIGRNSLGALFEGCGERERE